jgi:hypothetical protein
MRVLLQPHPTTSCHSIREFAVEGRRRGSQLHLSYRIRGEADLICWPRRQRTIRADELWRSTCLEAFVETAEGYLEFNASPSGEWASYRFSGYRQGMAPADERLQVGSLVRQADRLELDLVLDLPPSAGRLGLSAVIEETDGRICYWAAVHPASRPDFHHPDSFTLALPALEAS